MLLVHPASNIGYDVILSSGCAGFEYADGECDPHK